MALPQCFLRPIAHRGLHDESVGAIENSAAAFEAAIASGFGIECDVRSTADGRAVVFHDADGERLLGCKSTIAALDLAGISALRYPGGSSVLDLGAMLELVAGRVPILVEIKCDWNELNRSFLGDVARLANAYAGPLALMSFNETVMSAMARLAPDTPRGLVARRFDLDPAAVSELGTGRALRLSTLAELDQVAGSFAAFDVRSLPTDATQKFRLYRNLPLFAWTVRSNQEIDTAQAFADAPIFEGRTAAAHYSGPAPASS